VPKNKPHLDSKPQDVDEARNILSLLKKQAILIGASEFDDGFQNLPNVTTNLLKLNLLLNKVVGIDKDSIYLMLDMNYSNEITSEIINSISNISDMIIVYYAGHSLIHSKQLYLPMKKTMFNAPEYTGALLVDDLLQLIINKSKAKQIIFILDFCFSGLAGKNIDTRGKDIFLITATSSIERAKAESPNNSNYTAFTYELLSILENGVEAVGEILTLQDIFDSLKEQLESKNLPLPQITSYGSPNKLEICKNRAYYNFDKIEDVFVDENGDAFVDEVDNTFSVLKDNVTTESKPNSNTTSEVNMSKARQELDKLLNNIVVEPNEIDAIFVFDLTHGRCLVHNTEYNTDRQGNVFVDKIEAVTAILSGLRSINTAMQEYGQEIQGGKLQHVFFQLDEGKLILHFLNSYRLHSPIAIVFASTTASDSGPLLWHSQKYIGSITELLERIL